jgi:protein-disulfide isomerase
MKKQHGIDWMAAVVPAAMLAASCGPATAPEPQEPSAAGAPSGAVADEGTEPTEPVRQGAREPSPPMLVAEQDDPLTDLPMAAVPSREGAPAIGPEDAPIHIVVFSDFQCPFCSRHAETIRQLREHYGDQLRIVFRNYPLPFHPFARLAAEASMAAQAEGRFWEYHDLLFGGTDLSYDTLVGYAQQLGLDLGRFRNALDGGFFGGIVDQDLRDGRAAGVEGTPATFLNGRRMVGAQSLEEFERVIDLLLEAR